MHTGNSSVETGRDVWVGRAPLKPEQIYVNMGGAEGNGTKGIGTSYLTVNAYFVTAFLFVFIFRFCFETKTKTLSVKEHAT